MTKQELEQQLARLEANWARGGFCGPKDIIEMDKQMIEIHKRLVESGA
jgi:hypothetical protein